MDSPRFIHASLPDQPLVKVGMGKPTRVTFNWRDLWAYHELFYFLTWRDIKVRYKQTAMGAAWAVVQPFFTMLVFTVFFGLFVHVPSDGMPYPLFTYAGLLPWMFFSNAINNASNSLAANSHLIAKVYFPRILIPAAAVAAGLVDFLIGAVILIGLVLYYGIALTWSILLLPVFVLLMTLLALAIGVWASALNVKYRDIRHALPFTLQLWMFATPIIYPASVVPDEWRWALALNPMTGLIEGFRSALSGREFPGQAIIVSAVLTATALGCAIYAFRRSEQNLADYI